MIDGPQRRARVRRLSVVAIAAIVGLAACADFSSEPAEQTNQPSLSAAAMHPQDEMSFPIPTTPVTPSTDPSQSSAGQTAPADPCKPTDPTIIAACLDTPWGLAVLPDGVSALVGERKTGRILLVRPQTDPVLVAQIDGVDATGDGGLLGIALSPHFVEDGLVYAYVTTATDNSIMRIASGDVPKAIFTGIPKGSQHNGGRITFGADGFLYIATGDAGLTGAGDDPGSLAGKVLRIDEFGNPVSADRVGGTDPSSPAATGLPTTTGLPSGLPTTSAVPSGLPTSGVPSEQPSTSAAPTTSAVPAPTTGSAEVPGQNEAPADPVSAIYASGLVNPTGICQLRGGVGVVDRVGAADVLTQVSPRLDIASAGPVWSFQQIDGGGIDCAANETTLAATSLDQKLVTALTLGADGGFSGQPEQLAKDTYGRLLTLEPGAQGLLWATTSNLDGLGDPQPRDDMVVVIPTGASGGDGGRD